MIITVIGSADSGKSEFAEKRLLEIAGSGRKYYIATMVPFGDEGRRRVQKHRRQREGKGFKTLEIPADMSEANTWIDSYSMAEKMLELAKGNGTLDNNSGNGGAGKKTDNVLLECATNLTANILFGYNVEIDEEDEDEEPICGEPAESPEKAAEAAIEQIKILAEHVDNLVVVCTQYPVLTEHDEETKGYIRACDIVNEAMVAMSDEVVRI